MAKTQFLTEQIEVNAIPVRLIRSARRKTLSIEVDQEGLKARAPLRMRERTIREFISSKESWIRRHLQDIRPPQPKLELSDGAEIIVLGKPRRLTIIDGKRSKPILLDDELILPVASSHLPRPQRIQNKLLNWYRKHALEVLQAKVDQQQASSTSLKALAKSPKVKVREYKRRWGSCDHQGDLSFNWRIVMAPERVLSYVVIHEVAHLTHFNHSERFWNLVTKQMSDWREQQQWLADHGAELYRF